MNNKCKICGQPALHGRDLCLTCFLSAAKSGKGKRHIGHEEDDIQKAFFRTARTLFPRLGRLLFAVPNGGKRDRIEAARMIGLGVKAGVADIICLLPSDGYTCLCLETKTPTGTQSDAQREFQEQIERVGGKYILFRSAAEGIQVLERYLNNKQL
ncbi:VRR-NUC domain-containing protein [Parabacteroides sp. Marseille-P3160]|uniref:VRR-NUC domain-containing protein n=1 Tax=Parabacteroides sp. Marseille-P3160 TaxID=1917887 RepID=UPI0009BC488B|nr:VRR-NUC domain-containing protein [Parabacteroides sp. Marseille-P3160]